MDQARLRTPRVDRHLQRVDHDVGVHRRRHRPADDLAREQIHRDREVEPALVGRDVGHVRDPDLVGCVGPEVAIHAIGRDREAVVGVRGLHSEASLRLRTQAGNAHQARDPMPTAGHAAAPQRAEHARRAVDLAAVVEHAADQLGEFAVPLRPVAFVATEPRVETAPGDPQGRAQQAHLEGLPVVADELEPQFFAFAK